MARLHTDGINIERVRIRAAGSSRCVNCDGPIGDAYILSVHPTSNGLISYRRCCCGRILVDLSGEVLCGSDGRDPDD